MKKTPNKKSSPWQPTINYIILTLLLLEVLIVIIYLGSSIIIGQPYPPFDMNGQMTIPSLLQAAQMLTIASLSLLLFFKVPHSKLPPSQFFKLVIAFLLIYAAIDEIWKIHLQLGNWFPWLGNNGWKVIYIIWFSSVPILLYQDLRKLWRSNPRETFFAIVGLIFFAIGGLGVESLYEFIQPLLVQLFPQEYILMAIEKSIIAFEEFSELLAENSLLYSSLLLASQRLNGEKNEITTNGG